VAIFISAKGNGANILNLLGKKVFISLLTEKEWEELKRKQKAIAKMHLADN
jgi:hypothetical protein